VRRLLIAAAMAAGLAAPAFAADDARKEVPLGDTAALRAELKRLADRIDALETQNREMEKALATDRISEKEPEVITRLKAVEFQALSMQRQARQIENLEGISVGASLTGVLQEAGADATASGARESRANYRGDLSVSLPGGEMGDVEGKIFTHLRFGQGKGVGLKPTFTGTPNTVAFEKASTPADDSFAILAQAWYQLKIPLLGDGVKRDAREHVHLTAGKVDPFVFFDQNAIADDESSRFLNNVFVHNPLLDSGGATGADAYGFAPGAILQYVNERNKGAEWGLSLGVFGAGNGANFTGSLAHPFVIAQAETNARFSYLPGSYRAYVWSNGRGTGWDGSTESQSGIGFSANQKVADALTLFGRYGHQFAGKVRFDRALTLGGELGGSGWGRAADGLGMAVGVARAAASFRYDAPLVDADGNGVVDLSYAPSGSEKQFELYYRYKLNSRVELTPDFQIISRPGADGAAKEIQVVGLRAKVGF
jgi:hypothetical protein